MGVGADTFETSVRTSVASAESAECFDPATDSLRTSSGSVPIKEAVAWVALQEGVAEVRGCHDGTLGMQLFTSP